MPAAAKEMRSGGEGEEKGRAAAMSQSKVNLNNTIAIAERKLPANEALLKSETSLSLKEQQIPSIPTSASQHRESRGRRHSAVAPWNETQAPITNTTSGAAETKERKPVLMTNESSAMAKKRTTGGIIRTSSSIPVKLESSMTFSRPPTLSNEGQSVLSVESSISSVSAGGAPRRRATTVTGSHPPLTGPSISPESSSTATKKGISTENSIGKRRPSLGTQRPRTSAPAPVGFAEYSALKTEPSMTAQKIVEEGSVGLQTSQSFRRPATTSNQVPSISVISDGSQPIPQMRTEDSILKRRSTLMGESSMKGLPQPTAATAPPVQSFAQFREQSVVRRVSLSPSSANVPDGHEVPSTAESRRGSLTVQSESSASQFVRRRTSSFGKEQAIENTVDTTGLSLPIMAQKSHASRTRHLMSIEGSQSGSNAPPSSNDDDIMKQAEQAAAMLGGSGGPETSVSVRAESSIQRKRIFLASGKRNLSFTSQVGVEGQSSVKVKDGEANANAPNRVGRESSVTVKVEANTYDDQPANPPKHLQRRATINVKGVLSAVIAHEQNCASDPAKLRFRSMLESRKSIIGSATTQNTTPEELELGRRKIEASGHIGGVMTRPIPIISNESKQRWNNLWISLSWGDLVMKTAIQRTKGLLNKINHVSQPDDHVLEELQRQLEFAVNIENLLHIKPELRAHDVIQQLDKILKTRFADYSKLGEEERYHICRIMRMDKRKKDSLLLWEEHVVTCFYFILVGKIEIFKLHPNGGKLPLSIMPSGLMLGHVRVKVEGATRSACAALATDVILLVVEKEDYMRPSIGNKELARQSIIDPRAAILETTPLFKNLPVPGFFQKIAVFFEIKTWEKGEYLQEQDKPIDAIVWIIKGNCKVMRKIPFISHSQAGKVVMKSHTPGDSFFPYKQGEHEEKMVEVTITTQDDLGVGDWLPYIPISLEDTEKHFHIPKELIYMHRFKYPSEYMIVADSKVMTASVNFADFMDITSTAIIRSMIDNNRLVRYNLKVLQDQYLDSKAWAALKRTTVNEIVKDVQVAKKQNQKIFIT